MTGPATDRGVRLSAVEFDACWELLGLGDRPPALTLPSPGRTHAERRRVLADVLDRLHRRGLAVGDGPHPAIADLLGLLARADYEIDLHRSGGRVALAAVTGDRGVITTRHGDDVRIAGLRATEVVAKLVRLVGPMAPAALRPVNIPAGVLDEAVAVADSEVWAVADELAARRVPRVDASALARAFERVHDLGQFTVTAVVEGRRRRGPWAVGVHRTDSGWVGTVRRPEAGGATLSVFPLTPERLAARLDQLLRWTR